MAGWTPGHRPSQSSISSTHYPLPPALTARLQLSFLIGGITDASQYSRALAAIQSNPHIRASMTKCTLLQVFILLCVLGVDYLILPAWTRGSATEAAGRTRMDPETAKFYFQLFWLYPLIGISFLVSGSFFSNVASRAHSDLPAKASGRGGGGVQFQNSSSLVSRSLIIGVYLLISAVLSRIPLVGRTLSFLYLSMISSYYCFEYRFLSQSLVSLRSRIDFLESRWVYFLGFGLSPTLLSSSIFSSATLNLVIWSLLFPIYVLMASYSDPLPYDPVKPAKSHDLPGQEESAERGTTAFARRNLNPEARLPDWWPTRIPVLYLAVLLDDLVSGFIGSFMRSSASSGPKKSAEGHGSSYPSSSSASGYGQMNGVGGGAYAQRRDAYNFRQGPNGHPAAPGAPNGNLSALQSGFGNVATAPGYSGSSGFARQADTYFGKPPPASGANKYGLGGVGSSSTSPSKRNDAYGVGKSAGVSLRQEMTNGSANEVQSRRRAGQSQ